MIDSNALTAEEILEFCDLHTAILDGSIDLEGAKEVPAGHPVDTFKKENSAIREQVDAYEATKKKIEAIDDSQVPGYVLQLRAIFNNFSDIDKHYLRKEYLLFPFLEKHLITGPPKVMWGSTTKHASSSRTRTRPSPRPSPVPTSCVRPSNWCWTTPWR